MLAGFAGSVADALTLFDRFEAKLGEHPSLKRAAVELAKDWRTDRYLRRLEAMMLVADANDLLLLSGTGEVIEPDAGRADGARSRHRPAAMSRNTAATSTTAASRWAAAEPTPRPRRTRCCATQT